MNFLFWSGHVMMILCCELLCLWDIVWCLDLSLMIRSMMLKQITIFILLTYWWWESLIFCHTLWCLELNLMFMPLFLTLPLNKFLLLHSFLNQPYNLTNQLLQWSTNSTNFCLVKCTYHLYYLSYVYFVVWLLLLLDVGF